jgi:DNA-directed RNA polymerase specialized sigma24 family protein
MDAHIQQLRALSQNQLASLSERNYEKLFLESLRSGNGAAARLNALENHIGNLDGDICITERAPELLAAIFYQYFRLGYNSPTVGEQLGLSAPQVRQIIFRARKVAQREENFTPRKRHRGKQWRPEIEQQAA